jgi:hypothetical protein
MKIALIGPPGSGKSSIADAFVRLYGGRRLSFAAGVKQEVAYALSYVDHDNNLHAPDYVALMNDPRTKDQYRRLLQVWGTEFRREQDPDYWVKRLIQTMRESAGHVLIDDCRFPNEYDALKPKGFIFVKLETGETVREQGAEAAAHESELHWPLFIVDKTLSYQPGPAAQAERLYNLLNK